MIGTTVSHYRVTERLGAGGMGEIYLAEDLTLPRRVVLKFLAERLMDDARNVERFEREARAASSLEHPNICTIHEVGTTPDGRAYFCMPYYEGKTLQALLAEGPLPIQHAVTYGLGIAEGLAKAHAHGILHRDIKPSNIIITPDRVPILLDFGLALLGTQSHVTTTGVILGTVPYMSPEQATGKAVHEQSDIFSFGTTLYEMVTGINPFLAETPHAVVHKIVSHDPAPPSRIRPDVPPSLDRVITKAMRRTPSRRYRSMAAMKNDIHVIMHELDSGTTVSMRRLSRVRTRGVSIRLVLGVLAVALVLAGFANRHRLEQFLCLGGLGTDKGVAAIPSALLSSDAGQAPPLLDMTAEISRRLTAMAETDTRLWIPPQRRIQTDGITTNSNPRETLGVDAYFTCKLAEDRSDTTLRIALHAAGSDETIHAFEVSLTPALEWDETLTRGLAEALGIEIEPRTPGRAGTGSTPALSAYLTGLGHLASGDPDQIDPAIQELQASLARDSLFVDAHVGLASAWFAKRSVDPSRPNWPDASWASCGTALRLDAGRADAQELIGRIHLARNDPRAAESALLAATSLNPRRADAWHWLGWSQYQLSKQAEAEASYLAGIRNNPGYWGGHEDLGYLYYVQGRFHEAITAFKEVERLVPGYPPTYNYLGALYYAQDQWDEAIASFEKSFALGKTYAACSNLGTLYYMKERFEDAVRMYEWAWEYDSTNFQILGNLAAAYYWLPGERDRAVELFQEAAGLAETQRANSPNNAELLSQLAGYYSVFDADTATRLAEEAIQLAPENPEVHYRAALVYETLGNRPRALVLLGDAIERGFSMLVISHERELKELREDVRYKVLISENPSD